MLRHAYSEHCSADYGTTCEGESETLQSFKDSCDINNIMARYQKTGMIDHVNQYSESYGEMDGKTFYEHMNAVAEARTMFEDLPSEAREFFGHDVGKFLDYVSEGGERAEEAMHQVAEGTVDKASLETESSAEKPEVDAE